jgi:hypothetical protein
MEARAGVRTEEARDETMADERLESLERWRDDLEKRFAEAFPGGDHVGHCRYHQLMIEDIDSRKRLRQAVLEKTISGLAWAAVVGAGVAIWNYYFKVKGG